MSEDLKMCPNCSSPYAYALDGMMYACPECSFEWDASIEDELTVTDAHGNTLKTGDSVIIIKDLPVKGAPKPIKKGTKVNKIRIVEGDHNIDCKIDGFGSMALKSEFVKKF